MEATPLEFVSVKTTLPTLPLPAHATRPPIVTERLIIRPQAQDDLQAMHILRTQPEVMKWTAIGRVDADLEETGKKLALSLPPNDAETYNCAITLKSTGELIGCGGCHKFYGELGWPVIGYMFLKEFWGKGFATEFVQGFAAEWWTLPRTICEVQVDKSTVRGDGDVVKEQFMAVTEETNFPSQRILGKLGFEKVKVWSEADLHDPTGKTPVTLFAFAVAAAESSPDVENA